MINVFIKRENFDKDTHTMRMPYEHKSRNWGDSPIGKECQRLSATYQKLGKSFGTGFSLIIFKGHTNCRPPNFGIQLSGTVGQNISVG